MTQSTAPHLFSPMMLRGVTLPNRIVISPMQHYSAGADGLPTAFHRQHYGRLSLGGPGLLFTEALAVTAAGRVTNSDLGIWSSDHLPALAALVADIERFAGLVAIGREALHNPHWPLHAARALGRDDRFERWPPSWGWWLEKRAWAAALAENSTNATGG
jgi:2,4-dienoyl-CoA reductase-like NADH-dependent reductase (Old Yellow Enzyme family)